MLDFKTTNLKSQFDTLLDPKLQAVVLYLARRVGQKHNADLVLTCAVRSVSENVAVGGLLNSAHVIQDGYWGRAVDIRSMSFTFAQIEDIIRWVKEGWGDQFHIIHHTGTAPHIHLNINRAYATIRKKPSDPAPVA